MKRSSIQLATICLLLLVSLAARAQLISCEVSANPPIAMDDYAKWPGGPVVIDVLANDYDPDGDPLTIISFTSGANGTVAYTPDGQALLYTPLSGTAQSDQFTYTISDGMTSVPGTVFLSVAPPVPPPQPPPQAHVSFDYSCDALYCTFTAQWENISGAARDFSWSFDGSTPTSHDPRVVARSFIPGAHSVTVTVFFVSGQQVSSDPTPITIQAPQITCAFSPVPTGLVLPVNLTSVSTFGHPGFDGYDYFWDWGDGTPLQQVSSFSVFQEATHTYRTPGIRPVDFVVKAAGQSAVLGDCPHVIDFVNAPPIPDFSWSPGDGVQASKKWITFAGTGWDEWFSELGPWEWNFGDGTFVPNRQNPQHYYKHPGNYTVLLKVTDSLGATASVQKSITVANEPPLVDWVFNCTGRTCTFDSSRSSDDSDVASYQWNFGDGTPFVDAEDVKVLHTFAGNGPYDVTLTGNDGTYQVLKTQRVTLRLAPMNGGLVYYALPPCRILDTRLNGKPPLSNGTTTNYTVVGLCGIPPEAKAIAANAGVVSPTGAGSLFVFPAGASIPGPSAVDFSPTHSPRSNSTIVSLSASGALSVAPLVGTAGTTHVIMDVTGYFTDQLTGAASARGPLRFDPSGGIRIYDSRTWPVWGWKVPPLAAGVPSYFLMRLNGSVGLPLDADAEVLQTTAFNPTSGGWFNLYPSNSGAPTASALNLQSGISQSNGAMIGLGRRANDDVAIVYNADVAGSSSDFAIDNYGAFRRDGLNRYYPIEPCRAVDTRQAPSGGPRIAPNAYRTFQLMGNCGVPLGTSSVMVVPRIISPDSAGTGRIGSIFDQTIQNLQFAAGDAIANTMIVSLPNASVDGCCSGDLPVQLFGAGADFVLDVIGYFQAEVNQPPVANPDTVNAVLNVPVTINVLANDSDANGDAIKLSARGLFNPPQLGTATVASDTSITYTGTTEGIDRLDYEVMDTRGGLSRGIVTIYVHATNDFPLAVDDMAAANSGVPITVNVVANDSDPNGEVIALTPNPIVVAPTLGTATRASDTSITYTPNASAAGTDVLTYEIVDAHGAKSRGRLTIKLNRPPVATADAVLAQAGLPISIDVLSNDTDPDGDLLALDNPAIVTPPATGTASPDAGGRNIVYTSAGNASDSFQYAVTDGFGGRAVGTVTIVVNRPPVAANDTFNVGTSPADLNVTANDSDSDSGDPVALSSSPFKTLPSKGTVTRKNDSTVTYTPNAGLSGTDTFTIEVTDGRGGFATSTVTILLCSAAPSIGSQPSSRTINAGETTTLTVSASGGGTLAYQWYQGTSPSTTSPIGANSGSLVVTPAATTSYWVRVSNACGTTASTTATVTVCASPAIVVQPASTTIGSGSTATLSVAAGGSGPFTYQWYEGVSGTTTTPVGANSAVLTTPNLTVTKSYWVRISSNCNGTVVLSSNTATVTVVTQITRVQTAKASATSSTVTGSWSGPTQAGNLLVAVISASNASSPVATLTAPAGWQFAVNYEWNNLKTSIYFMPNNGGGRASETFSANAVRDLTLQLGEYAWMAAVAPLDQTVFTATSTPAAGSVSTGTTPVTAQSNELVITALSSYANTSFSNPTSSFVELSDQTAGNNLTTAVHERIVAATGGYGHSATVGSNAQSIGLVATFRGVSPIVSLTFSPSPASGGGSSTGTITLFAPPAIAVTIPLAGDNPSAATVPASVTVNAGQTTGTFTVTAATVATKSTTNISATYLGATRTTALDVCPPAPAITTQPASRTIPAGTPTTISVTATGGALAYQWYQGTAPSTLTPIGTNDSTLTVSPVVTTSYWVKVTNSCASTFSATAIVTACTPPGIATQPAAQTIAFRATATLSVTASGSGLLSYQWYQGNSPTTTTPVGTNSSTFTTPALETTTSYWVRVTSACNGGIANSATATITVVAPAIITRLQTGSGTAGSASSITVNWTRATQAGSFLVAVISASDVVAIGAFTPPAGWQLANDYQWNKIRTSIYYLPNAAGGRTSEIFGAHNYPALILQLAEYSGIGAVSPLDKTAFDGNTFPVSGTVTSGTTAVTAQSKELVITALTMYAQTTFTGATNSFTKISELNVGFNLTTAVHERLVTAPGAYGHSASAGGNAEWVGLAVTFKSADTSAALSPPQRDGPLLAGNALSVRSHAALDGAKR